ncbi:pyridoxamine 5'-phosphate oxidase family protein [Asticcacaulis sp. AC466]|uniref:pyridoxamine 5'-phosphate oxidase family protein n=1 Tax=Asticcacaulis sp. AC466 TaxID=1282362 RepID=UPI00042622FD|nr:pyridoxamine 5'-phosphate oxidase family protein [Asticcacaulis sp. AC466]
MANLHGAEAREKIWSLIKDIKVSMMATSDDAGVFHARPMMCKQAETFDGTLWFFTGADTEKAQEIENHPTALLTYSDTSAHRYVSVSGRAVIERDRAKIDALWSDLDKVWFPAGKEDPNLVLIRFEAEEAEFWDTPGAVATGLAYVKAFMTGELPKVGDVGKANLSH